MMHATLRDLFWATTLAAVACAWWYWAQSDKRLIRQLDAAKRTASQLESSERYWIGKASYLSDELERERHE